MQSMQGSTDSLPWAAIPKSIAKLIIQSDHWWQSSKIWETLHWAEDL